MSKEIKTVEEILESHCPSMNNLFLDNQGRAFRDRILSAMNEHTSLQLESAKKEIEELKYRIDDKDKASMIIAKWADEWQDKFKQSQSQLDEVKKERDGLRNQLNPNCSG